MEIRLNCENCDKPMPNDSDEAMICSFDCTFCKGCVDNTLKNVCPNCGGGFEKRPSRPKQFLEKYPPRKDKILKLVVENQFLDENLKINPRNR